MKLYIAGPMRGHPQRNYPEFEAAHDLCDSLGIDRCSPLDVDGNDLGLWDPTGIPYVWQPGERDVFRRDLALIVSGQVDGVLMLRGWADSEGASFERQLALMIGLREFRVIYSDELDMEYTPAHMVGIEEIV